LLSTASEPGGDPAAPDYSVSSAFGQGVYPVIHALPRDEELGGTRHSRRLRVSGRIPAVLYGVSEDGLERERQMLTVSVNELRRHIRLKLECTENTLYELDVEGKRSLVLPRQIQIRTAQHNLLSVNFLRFHRGTVVQFPLRFVDGGENAYLKRTGFLYRVKDMVKCTCHTFDLPAYLDVSIKDGVRKTVYTYDDIRLPPGLELAKPSNDRVIAVIKGPYRPPTE